MDAILTSIIDNWENRSQVQVIGAGIERNTTVNNTTLLAAKNRDVYVFYCERYGVESRGGRVYYRKSCDNGVT